MSGARARTRRRLRAAGILAFALGVLRPAAAMTAAERRVVDRGLDALYQADYDGADEVFQEAMSREPGNPVYSAGAAVSAWWRMECDFALPGSSDEKAFRVAVDRAIADAKRLSAGDDEARAQRFLYLGAAYGLRGRWRAARHEWLLAYWNGRLAYKSASRAVELDPGLYDADLGLGAFDYYVATLSKLVQVLVFTRGAGKEKGLQELRLAADKGDFSPVAAKLLLVGIYWTFEKDPRKAWALLDELHQRYPVSPVIDSMRLIGLFRLRDVAGLKDAAQKYLDEAERGADHYQPVDRAVGRCFLGLAKQLGGDPESALADYRLGLERLAKGHRWRSVLWLFTGEAHDLAGRRHEAVAAYRQALGESPLWGVPRYARYLLSRPFRAGDNPLPDRSEDLP